MIYNTKIVIDMESGEIVFRDLPHIHLGPIERLDKKAKAQASQAANTATNTATGYGTGATNVASTLVPAYRQEATNPTGFAPNDLNAMLVAGEQGAGGATGALAGEAQLGAARSRNSGALAGTLAELARGKTRALSQNALNVQGMNAQEKQRQRSEGLAGLSGIYGTDVGAQLKAEGLVPEDINAMVNADKTGWGKDAMDWMNTLTGGAAVGKYIHG